MTIKRRANAALFQIIDPDDQIVAGTWALTGPPVWLDRLRAPSMLRIVPLLGQWVPPVELLVPVVGRRTYVAVTRRRMICIRLSWPKDKPGQVVLAALRAGGASVELNGAQRDSIGTA